jgi:hypothetical protein
MTDFQNIHHLLSDFEPVNLTEVASVRLMDRIDSKYVASVTELLPFLSLCQDDFFVQEIDGVYLAEYFTTYYDTVENDYYRIHQTKRKKRQKIRVRNYVDTHTAFIEVKNKNNKGRTKKVRVSCLPDQEILLSQFDDFLSEKSIFPTNHLSPHVQNTFRRVTLLNKQRTERLTIDLGLSFQNQRTGNSSVMPNVCIIELKQQGNVHSKAKEILRTLRIKPRGFSKYCMGCALTNPDVSQNFIKQKIRLINKINN